MQQHFRITGSARHLPPKRISSAELDARLGFSPGQVFARTGVQFRHQACAPENAATMARIVINDALASAGRALRDVNMLIDASLCIQQPIPCNASLIQRELGPQAAGIACIDVHASCLGFVAALQMANGLFATGAARCIVVVCSETTLLGVNWDEPDSACLMGDGAAAFVLEAVDASAPAHACVIAMETFSEGADFCTVQGGGHRLTVFDYDASRRARYQFHMDGKAVHKLASRLLPPLVARVLREAGASADSLDVVPHQASGPALELIPRRLGIPRERLHVSIAEHGNLVAASIPYVLHGLRAQRPSGTRVMLLGTAAGYTQAAAVITL